MDLFSFTNSLASTATGTLKLLITLAVTAYVVVKCLKAGLGFGAILIGAATAGFVFWLTMNNGLQTIGQMINNTIKSAG